MHACICIHTLQQTLGPFQNNSLSSRGLVAHSKSYGIFLCAFGPQKNNPQLCLVTPFGTAALLLMCMRVCIIKGQANKLAEFRLCFGR